MKEAVQQFVVADTLDYLMTLVRDGVPPTAITVIGKGETQLLVPTGDGVREPQNRRVEIVIQ